MSHRLVIHVASNEQLPYTFENVRGTLPHTIVTSTLKTGDYVARRYFPDTPPVEHMPATTEACATVERKTLADLYGTASWDRERFKRELERMTHYGWRAIVIEAEWHQVFAPNHYLTHATKMLPKAMLASLLAWSQRYGVHIIPCPGRAAAELMTFRLLERWIRDTPTTAPQEGQQHAQGRAPVTLFS